MTRAYPRLPLTGIDHVVIGVADLEGSQGLWQKLGFTLTPRGRHIGWGTGNYCIMFPDDYLELLGIVDPAQFLSGLDAFLDSGEGIMGLAFSTDDPAGLIDAFRARDIVADGPKELKRHLELPTGLAEPAFNLVHPEASATPGLWSFVCHHLTPEIIRRPGWLEHANGACGIHSVTTVVEEPLSLRAAYERLFGHGAIIVTDATLVVRVGPHRLVFVGADDVELMHPAASPPSGAPLPLVFALTLRTTNARGTVDCLNASGVEYRELADGTLAIPPSEANGLLLEFKPA